MTIDELIAELEDYSPDTEVRISNSEGETFCIGRIQLNKRFAKEEHCVMIEAVK